MGPCGIAEIDGDTVIGNPKLNSAFNAPGLTDIERNYILAGEAAPELREVEIYHL